MSPTHVLSLIRGSGPLPGRHDPAWNDCARRLVSESLAGTALTLLEQSGRLADLPPTARAILTDELTRVRVSQALLFARFESFAACLRTAGVEFIVHKGGMLAPLVYPRLEDRPMVDIDVIFRPAAWRQVRDALMAAGYRLPQGATESFWLENYFNLSASTREVPHASFDLHWSLTQEGRYHVETEELFSRAVPFDLGAMRLLRLSDEDALLSLFLHLAYHYFEAQLIWLYDMKLVIEKWPIAWDRLLNRAGSWGLRTVCWLNLSYLEKVFPGLVPRGVLASMSPGAVRRAMLGPFLSSSPRHLLRGEGLRLNQFALGLLAIDRPSDAVRFAGDKVARTARWIGRRPRRR